MLTEDKEDFASLVDLYPPPADAGQEPRHQVKEAPPRRRKKERKGRTQAQSLDLHGMTEANAIKTMFRFFEQVRQNNREVTVHIIHGKGHRSADGPVLMRAVREWLKSKPAREAGVKDSWEGRDGIHEGGTGITVCELKPKP